MIAFIWFKIGIYFTGGSLNFARSLGPAAVNHHFPGYFWIYFVGPLLGSLLASGFYWLLNRLRYQTCNPGQDYSEVDEKDLKHGNQSPVHNGSEGLKAPNHQRNVSGATAVDAYHNPAVLPANNGFVTNNGLATSPVQDSAITSVHNPTIGQPVYHQAGQIWDATAKVRAGSGQIQSHSTKSKWLWWAAARLLYQDSFEFHLSVERKNRILM